MEGGEAFALTTPLIKKADGTKFVKTEGGNIWLDPARTSPYKFYQFWMNSSDEDSKNYIRIFTTMTKAEVEALESAMINHLIFACCRKPSLKKSPFACTARKIIMQQ